MWRDAPQVGSESGLAPQVFTNARIVTASEVIEGRLCVEGTRIAAIERGGSALPSAIDCHGDFLLPGFVDVHTDHLEKHAMPRAGVFWPPVSAVLAHDAIIAAAGITTVFNSLCLGAMGKPHRKILLPGMVEGVRTARAAGLLRVDHLLHLRCDLGDPDLEAGLAAHIDDPTLRFLTILDDSAERNGPDRYRKLLRDRGPIGDEDLERRLQASLANDPPLCAQRRRWLVERARDRGVTIASHDDLRSAHIDEAVELGMTISEFPITQEAASAAHAAGLTIIAGAPNIVNGGSHFGNVSVADLAMRDMVAILCSDYVPASLVHAVFMLADRPGGPSLPRAVAMISAAPARIFGLEDRGVLAPGFRADMVRLARIDAVPVVKGVWREGRRVA
ncbi:alpha-D-ribose 1-methylphosphonate 5-triphosphate diphosphatase [Labrys wisconsinensis]|uniref:Alpha-D-ribose 1-methylphosphonate 5-triphosphate diphosphatase n=1 Tax=Labrys wisconsinensis TaxID=425677 RepID=A0ABU0J9T9_9HYPH|nr:alpha-D-ribose 1-methylphosphonate 5-triphosphate diphosphatase [Labrys wisconsinensis]